MMKPPGTTTKMIPTTNNTGTNARTGAKAIIRHMSVRRSCCGCGSSLQTNVPAPMRNRHRRSCHRCCRLPLESSVLDLARGEEFLRRQVWVNERLLARRDVGRHRCKELAERRPACIVGEQRPALEPRRELGLQVEPEPERAVAEHVMHDAKLVDNASFFAAQQQMRFVKRDHAERRERHRPVL